MNPKDDQGNTTPSKRAQKCGHCGSDMKFIGKLPKVGHWPEAHAFLCAECKHSVLDKK